MAPDISKVDTDRPLNPALSAWYFRDEVLRLVFHGNSLSPFRKTCSSHFSVRILKMAPTFVLVVAQEESQRLSGADFPEEDFWTTVGASLWCGTLFERR